MKVNPEVFRQYDVRGLVERDLDVEFVEHLGKAYASFIAKHDVKKVSIGCDCRISGPRLKQAFSKGLLSSGLDVVDVGVVPTPVVYWSGEHLDVGAAVQITGSHNPPEYNGFKLGLGNGTIYGDDIQKLKTIIEKEDYVSGNGTMSTADVLDDYINDLAEKLDFDGSGIKVVVDAGNGTGGIAAVPLYKKLGCNVVDLFCDMDGNFPNHHPDPTVEKNLEHLKHAVAENSADLGISFDGDGDRIGVVDKQGTVIWGDKLMILFSRSVLEDQPGATILGEVKCSQTLYDDIAAHGGNGIMWKTGHSLIKAKMKEEHALLAGEMSGHIFFKHRYYGFDDAIYSGGRLLEIIAKTKTSVNELLADVPPTFSTPEIRIDVPEEIKFALVDACVDFFKTLHDVSVIDVDGARVVWPDGWGLVRSSNTQPILVFRYEAQSQKRLEEIQSYMEGEVERLKQALLEKQ